MHSRLFALESIFAFFYSISRLIQLAYFVNCWRTLLRRGEVQEDKLPPPYFFSANFSLLLKRGLKVGGGQHTTPAVGRRKESIMTLRASPLHQHTTRRGPYHRMYAYKDFYGGKARIPTPGGYSLIQTIWVCAAPKSMKAGMFLPILVWNWVWFSRKLQDVYKRSCRFNSK